MSEFQKYTQKTQELQQQITELMKIESEMQEYIGKTQQLHADFMELPTEKENNTRETGKNGLNHPLQEQ